MECFNINLPEYQTLKQKSGIFSDTVLAAYCQTYLELYNRYPYLDELPAPDSKEFMRQQVQMRADGSVETTKLLDTLQCNDVHEANVKLNDTYRDQEVHVLELNKSSVITSEQRPNFGRTKSDNSTDITHINNRALFNITNKKLSDLYGIETVLTSTEEIYSSRLNLQVPNAPSAKGFIFGGKIYINTDNATADTELHEMLHLLVGAMRFTDPTNYSKLLEISTQFPELNIFAQTMGNRTQNDILEEILVTELSKYLVSEPSIFDNMPKDLLHEVTYNIYRVLDSILMGNQSVAKAPLKELHNFTLRDLAQSVESAALNLITTSSLKEAEVHRIMANRKSELLTSKQLREECI